MKKTIVAGIVAGICGVCLAGAPALIPMPQKMTVQDGAFKLNGKVRLLYAPVQGNAELGKNAAENFASYFPSLKMRVAEAKTPGDFAIAFTCNPKVPKEGYEIHPLGKDSGFRVEASDAAGFFYANQTFRQLAAKAGKEFSIPNVEIVDAPRYGWRGLHFDDCRHFFGKPTLLRFIDLMAYHKFNVLHWHLTEDQGWRIAINKYPELVKYGAVRPESVMHGSRTATDGMPYGPFFYTQDDVKEIVAYAKARHVTVVPEIELPGHARAALAAYPEFSCKGKSLAPRSPRVQWGIEKDVLCAGNDAAIQFLEDVWTEVCGLFDSPIVHIGGDECPKDCWKVCPKCQARMKANNLKNENELQSWVTRHFEKFLSQKGRRIIGWDEILEGGLPQEAVVMSWRGAKGGIAAATAGHDVVMTPNTFCYFDYAQFKPGEDPFQYIGGYLPLEKVYSFDPCEGIPAAQQKHVLGGQGNNWSEYTFDTYDLDWKVYPRACALAETLWTAPAAPRDFAAFKERMSIHRDRLREMGVNCAWVK